MSNLTGPARLYLKTATGELSMPLRDAIQTGWYMITYVLKVWLAWYFFDMNGVYFALAWIALDFRGKL